MYGSSFRDGRLGTDFGFLRISDIVIRLVIVRLMFVS